MKAKLTSKGQITIPIEIRKRLNLKTGQILEFDESTPYLKATKSIDEDKMRAVLGCCKSKNDKSSKDLLNQLRGKVELP